MTNDPFQMFGQWYAEAQKLGLKEPTAMNLATATKSGAPSSRIVLLKNWDERGFVFYTNSTSRKGDELLENPQAALNFYWMDLQKQIRIEGKVEKVEGKDADDYYNSRHPESRIGAWASQQSKLLASRDELMKRVGEYKVKYGDNPPRPPHWYGFRVIPSHFEFWQEGDYRLHQRDIFERNGNDWKHYLINP